MKLIIDIPEIFYQNEKENKGYVSDLKRDIVWDAMIKGTPLVEQEPILDKIREEIHENINYNKKMNYQGIVAGLLLTFDIIDKYREGANK